MTTLSNDRKPSRVTLIVAPAVLGVALIALWQATVSLFHIPVYFVPAPRGIWDALIDQHGPIASATRVTGWNALRGLIVGAIAGLAGALIAHSVPFLRDMAAPIVVAFSVVPIVALGPVLYALFGGQFHTARVIVAAISVAVPVYITTLRGLKQVLPVHRDLMHAYSVSARRSTTLVTLPTAAPYAFTGLRIGSSLAVISALITEYFGGPGEGLGIGIRNSATSGRIALAWAYVLGSIVLGLIFYVVTYAVERLAGRHRAA